MTLQTFPAKSVPGRLYKMDDSTISQTTEWMQTIGLAEMKTALQSLEHFNVIIIIVTLRVTVYSTCRYQCVAFFKIFVRKKFSLHHIFYFYFSFFLMLSKYKDLQCICLSSIKMSTTSGGAVLRSNLVDERGQFNLRSRLSTQSFGVFRGFFEIRVNMGQVPLEKPPWIALPLQAQVS